MSDEFGDDLFTITDDDGNEYVLEHLDTIEMDGSYYLAFLPTDVDENSDDYGMLIMKQAEHDGEDYLDVPDDEEAERAYNIFMQRLFSDEETESE